MTDQLRLQPGSSGQVEESPIELEYPRISIPSPLAVLIHQSAIPTMATRPDSEHSDPALSESWTNLSDADYSLDDDIYSETTDAASLLDHAGPDDIRSIDEHTSDAGSEAGQSDRSMSQDCLPQRSLVESTKTLRTESIADLKQPHSAHLITLRSEPSQNESDCPEVTHIIKVLDREDTNEILGYSSSCDDYDQMVGRVCMTISKDNLDAGSPFRLLYIGDTTARAQILAKIGDALMAARQPEQNAPKLDASRYHVISSSDRSNLPSDHPELIPIRTQIIVDDCFTAASIKNEADDDHIFLSFKNGSLYSSRWNGTRYEVSPPSQWTPPDLAIFFLARNDPAELRQRHQTAHDFVSRHKIPQLIISETLSWGEGFTNLSLDPKSPHLRLEVQLKQDSGKPPVARSLPIDLKTFRRLDPEQLNKNLAYLCKSEFDTKIDARGHASVSRRGKKSLETFSASKQDPLELSTGNTFFTESALHRTAIMAAAGLMSLLIGLVACNILVALFMHSLASHHSISEPLPVTAWTLQSSPVPTISEKTAAVIPSASSVVVTGSNSASKGLATIYTPSELAEMISSKSLQATNRSDNFQVHSLGDCHIVVKTPRGFKVRNKSLPLDVVVARGGQAIDSSLSKLFDGVYTIRIRGEDAYGLLNVTIKGHKSFMTEECLVDFGAKWLKVAGWKKAAQIASEQVRSDLETAQVAVSAAYEELSEDFKRKATEATHKAARQAHQSLQQSRLFLQTTRRLLKAKSNDLCHATDHERHEAYTALRKRADLALQTLVVYAHTANERGRDVIANIFTIAGQTAKHIQQGATRIDLADVQNKMQEYMRSDALAKAQERAKQMVRDTSNRWRQRRALRRVRRSGCSKKRTACNR